MPGEVSELAPVETWQPGDEFRWNGEHVEIVHVDPSHLGRILVYADGGKPGAPQREFVAPTGTVRRVWRHAPTKPTISWKDEPDG